MMLHHMIRIFCVLTWVGAAVSMTERATAAGHAGAVDVEQVVAIVGDVEIRLGHVLAEAALLKDDFASMSAPDFFTGVVERLIQQEAVAQSVGNISALTRFQSENERRSLVASEGLERIAMGISATEDQLRAAYDRQFSDDAPGKEFNASHILVETMEEAMVAITRLASGGEFAGLARELSQGPSASRGGDLGWFGAGRMVPPFEAAVRNMEPGQISPPIQTDFGWHVIRLNDTRIPNVPAFAEKRAMIEEQVEEALFVAAVQDLILSSPVERMRIVEIDAAIMTDPQQAFR